MNRHVLYPRSRPDERKPDGKIRTASAPLGWDAPSRRRAWQVLSRRRDSPPTSAFPLPQESSPLEQRAIRHVANQRSSQSATFSGAASLSWTI